MNQYELAKCIQKEQWSEAWRLLASGTICQKHLKLKTLLARLFGQIDDERKCIEDGRIASPNDGYYIERQFSISLQPPAGFEERRIEFSKNVDSQVLALTNDICFITAGDTVYATLLMECIWSINVLPAFKRAPIYVIDCGLQFDERRHLLSLSDRVEIISTDRLASCKSAFYQMPPQLFSLYCRGIFRELFPDSRFCMWIDADAWVQNEESVFEYLMLALRQGLAVSEHPFRKCVTSNSHWLQRGTLSSDQIQDVLGCRAIIACSFCFDTRSHIYAKYCDVLWNNAEILGPLWGMDQEVMLWVVATMKLEILPTENAYEGTIYLKIREDGAPFIYSFRDRLIGIYHLGGGRMEHRRKWEYSVQAYWAFNDGELFAVKTGHHYLIPKWSDHEFVIDLIREEISHGSLFEGFSPDI